MLKKSFEPAERDLLGGANRLLVRSANSREYRGRRVDVLVTMDRGFAFAADLIRRIDAPMVGHFFRADVRGVDQDAPACREILFGSQPELKGRDILVVDAVLDSDVTQDFFLRRLGEPRVPSAGRCFWTSPAGGAWPWSRITSASGLHLNR